MAEFVNEDVTLNSDSNFTIMWHGNFGRDMSFKIDGTLTGGQTSALCGTQGRLIRSNVYFRSGEKKDELQVGEPYLWINDDPTMDNVSSYIGVFDFDVHCNSPYGKELRFFGETESVFGKHIVGGTPEFVPSGYTYSFEGTPYDGPFVARYGESSYIVAGYILGRRYTPGSGYNVINYSTQHTTWKVYESDSPNFEDINEDKPFIATPYTRNRFYRPVGSSGHLTFKRFFRVVISTLYNLADMKNIRDGSFSSRYGDNPTYGFEAEENVEGGAKMPLAIPDVRINVQDRESTQQVQASLSIDFGTYSSGSRKVTIRYHADELNIGTESVPEVIISAVDEVLGTFNVDIDDNFHNVALSHDQFGFHLVVDGKTYDAENGKMLPFVLNKLKMGFNVPTQVLRNFRVNLSQSISQKELQQMMLHESVEWPLGKKPLMINVVIFSSV